MNITLGFECAGFDDPEAFALFVVGLLEALVPLARFEVSSLPPLYYSGVRFREEPSGYESLVDPNTVHKRGFGDCAHLSVWRVAELRNAGEHATFRVRWDLYPSQRLFHVQVRRGDGSIEDPSVELGMPAIGVI